MHRGRFISLAIWQSTAMATTTIRCARSFLPRTATTAVCCCGNFPNATSHARMQHHSRSRSIEQPPPPRDEDEQVHNSSSSRLVVNTLQEMKHWQQRMSAETHTTDTPDETTTTTRTPQGSLWDDRLALQSQWTLAEKGWKVAVEWKMTSYGGVGVFAAQDIPAGTVLRQGVWGVNLYRIASLDDVHHFVTDDDDDFYYGTSSSKATTESLSSSSSGEASRVRYLKDYLWGFYPSHLTDEQGYFHDTNNNHNDDDDPRIFAMWIPGNGLNHSPVPNTVYVSSSSSAHGIDLLALTPIAAGDELYDDYRRHGASAPPWLRDWATSQQVTLNFADSNDFVK